MLHPPHSRCFLCTATLTLDTVASWLLPQDLCLIHSVPVTSYVGSVIWFRSVVRFLQRFSWPPLWRSHCFHSKECSAISTLLYFLKHLSLPIVISLYKFPYSRNLGCVIYSSVYMLASSLILGTSWVLLNIWMNKCITLTIHFLEMGYFEIPWNNELS